jgi:hypothetical protein
MTGHVASRQREKGGQSRPFLDWSLRHADRLRSVDNEVMVMVMMPPVVLAVVMMMTVVVAHFVSRGRLDRAGERAGGDEYGDKTGNERALEHDDLLDP